MNQITNELQRGYKNSKSTMVIIIFYIKQKITKNESEGPILFDLSGPFVDSHFFGAPELMRGRVAMSRKYIAIGAYLG